MKLTANKAWKAFSKALEPQFFSPIMEKHVERGTKKNGIYLRTQIRNNIRAGLSPKNAALTAYIKGGDKPIVGTKGADLFNSITSSVKAWHTVEVGVLRQDELANIAQIVHEGIEIKVTPRMRQMFWLLWLAEKGKFDPSLLYGRARELWDLTEGRRKAKEPKTGKPKAGGSQKKPSPRKKGKSGAGEGGKKHTQPSPPQGFKPISPSTNAIIIPSRPYIKVVIEQDTVKRTIKATWAKSLVDAMDEQVRSGMKI